MLSILVPSFLLIVIAHQPLNTLGGGVPKDTAVQIRIERIKKGNERTRIFKVRHPFNTFGGTMPEDSSASELSEALKQLKNENELIKKDIANMKRFYDGRFLGYVPVVIEPQQSEFHNILTNGRSKDENNSPNYDVAEFHNILTTVRSQEEKNLPNYDEQFNCIGNCRSEDESCSTATLRNESKDGVYLLKGQEPDLKSFYVYCQQENENEKAWAIIQRRQDGSVNFTRNWLDYKLGFGDLNGEYWIGLERIHQLTNSQPHELLIVLYDFKLGKHYAKYSEFVVGTEDEGYKLTVKGHSGDVPDSFLEHSSMKFSTIDRDNDLVERSCANDWKGGWWYKNCYLSNLNGVYDSSYTTKLDGINWVRWTEYISLQKVFMAIRPIEV